MDSPESGPWAVSEETYPRDGRLEERLGFLLRYAILAPSSHNTQPWLFRLRHDAVELYADRLRSLPIADPEDRELIMSCGAALAHLRVAMRYFGHQPEVTLLPGTGGPDLLAVTRVGAEIQPTERDRAMFEAIRTRRTNREPFVFRPVPDGLLGDMQDAAYEEGAWLRTISDTETMHRLADLIGEADRMQADDSEFRKELASWVHPNRGKSSDGMPGYALGIQDVASYGGPFVIRTFDWGDGRAAKDRQLVSGSPALAVLGTGGDTTADWLAAGQALEHVQLLGRAEGLYFSYLNQPLEIPILRDRVRDLLGTKSWPQLILRVGFGPSVKPTPRRPVEDVLL
jgi:hypothetical protein